MDPISNIRADIIRILERASVIEQDVSGNQHVPRVEEIGALSSLVQSTGRRILGGDLNNKWQITLASIMIKCHHNARSLRKAIKHISAQEPGSEFPAALGGAQENISQLWHPFHALHVFDNSFNSILRHPGNPTAPAFSTRHYLSIPLIQRVIRLFFEVQGRVEARVFSDSRILSITALSSVLQHPARDPDNHALDPVDGLGDPIAERFDRLRLVTSLAFAVMRFHSTLWMPEIVLDGIHTGRDLGNSDQSIDGIVLAKYIALSLSFEEIILIGHVTLTEIMSRRQGGASFMLQDYFHTARVQFVNRLRSTRPSDRAGENIAVESFGLLISRIYDILESGSTVREMIAPVVRDPEEQLSSIGDPSDIESVFSMESFQSSQSSMGTLLSVAVTELANIFLSDEELMTLYPPAISKVGPDRFQRNFARLLKKFGRNLEPEITNDLERQAVYFVRISAKQTAAEVRLILRQDGLQLPGYSSESQASMVNRWLETHDFRQRLIEPAEENDDDFLYESDSELSEGYRNSPFQHLEEVKGFLLSTQAFFNLRQDFRLWLNPVDEREVFGPKERIHEVDTTEEQETIDLTHYQGQEDSYNMVGPVGEAEEGDPELRQELLGPVSPPADDKINQQENKSSQATMSACESVVSEDDGVSGTNEGTPAGQDNDPNATTGITLQTGAIARNTQNQTWLRFHVNRVLPGVARPSAMLFLLLLPGLNWLVPLPTHTARVVRVRPDRTQNSSYTMDYDIILGQPLWLITLMALQRAFESILGCRLHWGPFAEPEEELQLGYIRIFSTISGVIRFYDDIPLSLATKLFPGFSDSPGSGWKGIVLRSTTLMKLLYSHFGLGTDGYGDRGEVARHNEVHLDEAKKWAIKYHVIAIILGIMCGLMSNYVLDFRMGFSIPAVIDILNLLTFFMVGLAIITLNVSNNLAAGEATAQTTAASSVIRSAIATQSTQNHNIGGGIQLLSAGPLKYRGEVTNDQRCTHDFQKGVGSSQPPHNGSSETVKSSQISGDGSKTTKATAPGVSVGTQTTLDLFGSGKTKRNPTKSGHNQPNQTNEPALFLCTDLTQHESVVASVKLSVSDKETFQALRQEYQRISSEWWRWKRVTGIRFYRFRSFLFKQTLNRLYVELHKDRERYPTKTDPEYYEYRFKPQPWPLEAPYPSREVCWYFLNPEDCGTSTMMNEMLPVNVKGSIETRCRAFGIYVEERYSVWGFMLPAMLLMGLTLVTTLWFIPYWLASHPDDLQGAAVPITVAANIVTLLGSFSMSVLAFRFTNV